MIRLSFLCILLFLIGCSSQRRINREATATVAIADTTAINLSAMQSSFSWQQLTAGADNLSIWIRADSIITPGGSVIHNPGVEVTAARPLITSEEVASTARSDSISAERSTAITADTAEVTKEESRRSATNWPGLILLLLAIVFILRFAFR